MKSYSRLRAAAVAALFAAPVAALPVAAFAQTSPLVASHTSPLAAPRTSPLAASHSAGEMSGAAQLKVVSKNVEAHIAQLHGELRITPAEEGQWTQFAQVMRNNAAQMDAAFSQRGASLQTMNAVQDLQSYAQISQIQSDNMQKLATAFETLYTGFPAAQQKVADGVFRPRQVKPQ